MKCRQCGSKKFFFQTAVKPSVVQPGKIFHAVSKIMHESVCQKCNTYRLIQEDSYTTYGKAGVRANLREACDFLKTKKYCMLPVDSNDGSGKRDMCYIIDGTLVMKQVEDNEWIIYK